MTMDRHVEIADQLEAYLLGGLTEHEIRDVEAHLQNCVACARDVNELRKVLTGIGESVPPITPPPSVRERVLAAVATESQEPARPGRRVGVVEQPRGRLWGFVPLAAAAVLILAIGSFALVSEQSRRDLVDEVSRVRASNDELLKRVQLYAGQTDLALSILTAGDMREIPLTGSEGMAATAARAYWSPGRGLLFVADRLPAPPPGRIYQVWIIEKGTTQPVSAGLLGEEPGGRGMLIVTPPKPGSSGSVTVAVSDEPPGGSPGPTVTPRLAGSI